MFSVVIDDRVCIELIPLAIMNYSNTLIISVRRRGIISILVFLSKIIVCFSFNVIGEMICRDNVRKVVCNTNKVCFNILSETCSGIIEQFRTELVSKSVDAKTRIADF